MTRVRSSPLAAVACAALVLSACGSGDGGEAPTTSGAPTASASTTSTAGSGVLAATDGRPTTVATKVDLGGSPCGVATGFGAVWVSNAATGELVRLDPTSGEVTARTKLADKPCEITVTDDALWVVTQSGVVERVDPRGAQGGKDPRVVASVPTGFASYQAAEAFGSIWVSNRNSQSLTRIDPKGNKATTVELPGTNAGGVVEAAGALWVGDDTTGSTKVVRLDPTTLEPTPVDVGCDRPAYLAATGDTVWVSCVRSGTVARLDATSSTTSGAPVPAGASPVNLHARPDGRWVWVPDDETDLLTRIDAASGAAVERVRAGDGPAVVAPTDDGVWVTNFGDGTVWRLATASG